MVLKRTQAVEVGLLTKKELLWVNFIVAGANSNVPPIVSAEHVHHAAVVRGAIAVQIRHCAIVDRPADECAVRGVNMIDWVVRKVNKRCEPVA